MKNSYEYHLAVSFIKQTQYADYSKEDAINALAISLDKHLYEHIDDAQSSGRDATFEFVSHSLTPTHGGFILSLLARIKETK